MPVSRIIKFFSSLRLTVVCLALGILLVFFGTLAQVDEGLYAAQNRWFRSFVVVNAHIGRIPIPIFPGGYLLGTVLLVNLLAAHITRFKFTWRKSGIMLTHFGIILMLIGQLLTDMLSTESALRLEVGETRNYSEDFHANELVVIDTTDPASDQLVSIPEKLVAKGGEIGHAGLPMQLRVKGYWPNCEVMQRPPDDARPSEATHGAFAGHLVQPIAENSPARDPRAAVLIELVGENGSLGTWLVPSRKAAEEPERLRVAGRRVEMAMVFAPALGGHFLMLGDPGRSQHEQPDPIGERELTPGREIAPAHLPFKIRVREFWPRCALYPRPTPQAVSPGITRGPFRNFMVEPMPPAKKTNERNTPAAVVEVLAGGASQGTWLLPAGYLTRQSFEWNGRTYDLAMRFTRHYKPFSVTLLDASHKKYRGTEIPRDYRSRVRVQRADTGEVLESEVYMNAPLRFAGYTFFQFQMAADEAVMRPGDRPSSTFQVVKNPGWITPYLSCVLVGVGLTVQFLIHLVGFILKRRPASA